MVSITTAKWKLNVHHIRSQPKKRTKLAVVQEVVVEDISIYISHNVVYLSVRPDSLIKN
jgi:hypothetical protein